MWVNLISVAFFPITSELVINLHMDPYYEHQWTKALNLVVCLRTRWQKKSQDFQTQFSIRIAWVEVDYK